MKWQNCFFNGDEENYNRWEIPWNAFAQVKQVVSAIKSLDSDMHVSGVALSKTEKTETTDKAQKATFKAKRRVMAYLYLALNPKELLGLLTQTVTVE